MSNIKEKIKELYPDLQWDKELKTLKLGKKYIGNNPKKSAELLEITTQLRAELNMSAVTDYNMAQQIVKIFKEEEIGKKDKSLEDEDLYRDKPWLKGLELDKFGRPLDTSINYIRIFETHPFFKNKIHYDETNNCECYENKPFDDTQQSKLKVDLERELGVYRTKTNVVDAVRTYCIDHRFNPLKETLSKLVWDGEERMENLFIKVFECDDIPYIHNITKQFFFAWIHRMLEPGCKFDIMFMFEGEQGIGKSELFLRMIELINGRGVDKMKFKDDRSTLEKVTKYQICCFDEISDITRVDLDSIKAFISSRQDTFDEKYRSVQTKKRSCILVGSLNPDKKHFLKDITTAFERRFAIIPCHAKGTKDMPEKTSKEWWKQFLPDEYLLQVWAEAIYKVTHEKDFDWMAWDSESLKYAISLQEEYSSLNDDDGLKAKLEDLFSYRYTKDCYYNLDEFKEAVDNAKMMCNPTGVELKQIKCGVLHAFIKDVLKESRSPQWIQGMMRTLGWEPKQTSIWLKGQNKNLAMVAYKKHE